MDAPLKAVMVGCGSISEAWLRPASAMPALQLVGFVDLREDAARARAAAYGLPDCLVSADLDAVLDQAAPDVVFDCTNPEAHAGVVMAALRRGCHVLGEKPLAHSMEAARGLVAAAQAAGRVYAITQNRRYDPNIRRLKALIDSGALGPLTVLNADFFVGAHFRDFRDHTPHILLYDMAIHTFDAARYLTGADPVSVYCKEWNPPGSWYDRDAAAVAVFEMTGGLVFTYRGSWCAEGLRTTWESDWRVVGQQGSARWDGAEAIRAEAVAQAGGFFSDVREVAIPPAEPLEAGHAGVIAEFVRCVRAGGTPLTAAADNLKSLAMTFAAIESAERGLPVPVRW